MNDMTFTGKDLLVELLNNACAQETIEQTTDILRDGLSRLIAEKSVFLPECVFEPVEGHYARRELYKCPETGVTVVADLYTDSLGDPPLDTYEAILGWDADRILEALGG